MHKIDAWRDTLYACKVYNFYVRHFSVSYLAYFYFNEKGGVCAV